MFIQEVQEAQRVPKKLDTRRNTSRDIIITLPKMKDKERILKAAREKETVTTKEFPPDYQLISQKKPCRQGVGKKYSNQERQGPIAKISLSSKVII